MDEEDTIDRLKAIYEDLLKQEVDDEYDGGGEIDYNLRIKQAVQSGKFRLSINVNDLRSRSPETIQG